MPRQSFIFKQLPLMIWLSLTLLGSLAFAWPPTYGAEFEVRTIELSIPHGGFDKKNPTASIEKQAQMKFVAHMRERCAAFGCSITPVPGKWQDDDFKVQYADGWWFKISYDPGCVEITFKPSNSDELEKQNDRINNHIFKTAAEVRMTSEQKNANHFNIGIRSAFGDSAEDFLKFFADYQNRPDLALGGLGKDLKNGPPLSVLGKNQRTAFQDVVNDFKAGRIRTLAEAARAIEDRVYTSTYNEDFLEDSNHYQAIGLKYVNRTDLTVGDAPLELRPIYGQTSAEAFRKIARLMEARIQFLKTNHQALYYNSSARTEFTLSELRTRLFIYIEETGLKYEDYKDLTLRDVQRAPLSPLVDVKVSAKRRLPEIEKYWDLIQISPLVRKAVAEILASPDVKDDPQTKKIIERLENDLKNLEPEVVPEVVVAPEVKASWYHRFLPRRFRKTHASSAAATPAVPDDTAAETLGAFIEQLKGGPTAELSCQDAL